MSTFPAHPNAALCLPALRQMNVANSPRDFVNIMQRNVVQTIYVFF
jgi:hypothetical protein